MSNDYTLSIANNVGRAFLVRVVETGDRYGLNDCRTHTDADPLVEFYDATQDPEKFGPRGQFVSSYYVDTILGRDTYGRGHGGLDLAGGVPVWSIDADAMATVRDWLTGLFPAPAHA